MKRMQIVAALAATATLCAAAPARAGVVGDWNAITVNCAQGPLTPANRAGPAGLLDIALVHAAMHDAVQAIEGRFEPYEYSNRALRGKGSRSAAAAAAAYGVLAGLYGVGNACLASVAKPSVTYAGDPGLKAGEQAAAALLPLQRPTFTLPTDPWIGSDAPGQWRPTPGVTQGASTFLAHTAPFALKYPGQFRPAPPPPLTSFRYARDYEEVKAIGAATGSTRSAAETDLARFWSMNFFVQWNDALRGIAEQYVPDVGDAARLFALASFAAADSQISVYEAKYRYNFWRPITAIQNGEHDGNARTKGDPAWNSFVPAPAYPEYSSGANCLVAAITTVLESFFDTNEKSFQIRSTAPGVVTTPRTYARFSDAAREVVEVRILQGIHFRFAEDAGRVQGERVGRWTYRNYLQPVRGRR